MNYNEEGHGEVISKCELRNDNANLCWGFIILKFEIRNSQSEMFFSMPYALCPMLHNC
jgi:hypothetical protein